MDWQAAIDEHKKRLSRYIWTDGALALAAQYRESLTQAGFSESTWPAQGKNLSAKNPLHFYRPDTELTAFFVNLEPAGEGIRIFYGFASTAFARMRGDEISLGEKGIDESQSALRFMIPLCTEAVETDAAEQITAVYEQYHGTDKDALLAILKEHRKAWLARITAVLKPLGFRKKGNEWYQVLPSGHTLYFAADKGSYSDGYNFDVRLRQPPVEIRLRDWCAFAILDQEQDRAIDPFCHHGFDWQLDPPEELDRVLDWFLTKYYRPMESQDREALKNILYCGKKECPIPDCPLHCAK